LDKKKRVSVLLIILVLGVLVWKWSDISSLFNGGFHQDGKVGLAAKEDFGVKNNSATKKTQSDEKKEENDNPKDSIAKRERMIVEDTDYSLYDNTLYAWWFKRNDNHEKSGCQEDFDITQYDAYYTVPVSEKKMYITFDCGYENGFTPDMLDVLKDERVTAAFFVTQTFIRDNIDLVKRMKEEGHLVGNHTVRHLSSPTLTPEELEAELYEVAKVMYEQTGYRMDPFFRPPMGEYSERTLKVTQDMGYSSVFWSIAYYDYDVNDQPGKDYVTDHFATYHHNGCIALLHNISESNTQALGEVIDGLQKENYRFGLLTELEK